MNDQSRQGGALTLLIACALCLTAHLVYLYMADKERFPINTIKIAATYQHVSHKELETILEKHVNNSFFSLSITKLREELNSLEWIEQAIVERIWPDVLKIVLIEKVAEARWNNNLLSQKGEIFNGNKTSGEDFLPLLKGPENESQQVLQVYKKLSKILSTYHLQAATLELRENDAWDLVLSNGIRLRLGKNNLEQKLNQFCKAWISVFSEASEQIASADLRYPHGMAVQLKKKREDNG